MKIKYKKCPECGWKISMFSKKLKVVEGSRFKCLDCGKALIYRTGVGNSAGPLAGFITALSIPTIFYLMSIDENRALQVKIFGVIVVFGGLIILTMFSLQHFEDGEQE